MDLKTQDLEQGTQRGFRWFLNVGENGARIMYIVAPGGKEVEEIAHHSYEWNSRGFYPFDDSVPKPDHVKYNQLSYRNIDLKAWIEEHVPFPEGCDIKIDYQNYIPKLRLIATTVRNGTVSEVAKTVKTTEDVIPQIKTIFRYFERNCPAPKEGDLNQVSASPIANGMISLLTADAIDIFRKWHEESEKVGRPGGKMFYRELNLDGDLLKIRDVKTIRFRRKFGLKQVLIDIYLTSGHSYSEDANGASLLIDMPENNIIMASAKGSTLSNLIDLPGSEKAIIRKAGLKDIEIENNKKMKIMHFRVGVEKEGIQIPDSVHDPIENVYQDLKDLMGPTGHFKEADVVLVPFLEELEPRNLRSALTLAKNGNYVNLRDFGGPDVSIEAGVGFLRIGYAARTKLAVPEYSNRAGENR